MHNNNQKRVHSFLRRRACALTLTTQTFARAFKKREGRRKKNTPKKTGTIKR